MRLLLERQLCVEAARERLAQLEERKVKNAALMKDLATAASTFLVLVRTSAYPSAVSSHKLRRLSSLIMATAPHGNSVAL